jgi:hypothetical protein
MIDQRDLEAVQRIREEWDATMPPAELADIRKYIGAGVTEYQFWLETRLMYARRWRAEMTYQRDAWAKKYREALGLLSDIVTNTDAGYDVLASHAIDVARDYLSGKVAE